ncbi:hypothetical protein THASP1DRAFT_28612 [Thamnocephalis sphaerospora]|uniref:Uncharacterized protein n=1 Tax=Thamnocephalis sphaerospora TaxID=78915 RepID=A0A4P9XTT7_9FUNG|nr:hypothetical protein THASP1DRAFT_28612 [Thamnocephalis sphaerospora]|eukprot:RKP09605.1 hypothetical protein THASP1DRAFT_28612 [Thamnocephalis sphaerospora]
MASASGHFSSANVHDDVMNQKLVATLEQIATYLAEIHHTIMEQVGIVGVIEAAQEAGEETPSHQTQRALGTWDEGLADARARIAAQRMHQADTLLRSFARHTSYISGWASLLSASQGPEIIDDDDDDEEEEEEDQEEGDGGNMHVKDVLV